MIRKFATPLNHIEVNKLLDNVVRPNNLVIKLINSIDGLTISIDGNSTDVNDVIEQLKSLDILT